MLLKHFFTGKIAHSSYILAGKNSCAVIDPQRDIKIYLDDAAEHGYQIKYVILTHFHADFVSGHLELAQRTGATIHLGAAGQADYPFEPAREGDVLQLGSAVRIEVLETWAGEAAHQVVIREPGGIIPPVGIKLSIIPHINQFDQVRMEIEVEVSEVDVVNVGLEQTAEITLEALAELADSSGS